MVVVVCFGSSVVCIVLWGWRLLVLQFANQAQGMPLELLQSALKKVRVRVRVRMRVRVRVLHCPTDVTFRAGLLFCVFLSGVCCVKAHGRAGARSCHHSQRTKGARPLHECVFHLP